MLNCREVTRLFSEAQERKLTFSERMNLKMHIMMCKGCNDFGKQIKSMRSLARTFVRKDIELSVSDSHSAETSSSPDKT